MAVTRLNPSFHQLVAEEGWDLVLARGNTTARKEQIVKDGVILEYFCEIGGEDREFSISSPALLRADSGLTIVPSFERVFRDLDLQFTNTGADFKTVSDHLPRVKAYLGNVTLLQSRLKEKEDALQKSAKQSPRRFLLYRLRNRIWTDEYLQQMRRVDEVHQRAAAEKLPLLKAAIESLSRISK